MTFEEIMKLRGYRKDLDCKDVKVMVLEGYFDRSDTPYLYDMGVDEISEYINQPSAGMILDHATVNASLISAYLKNCKTSLYANTPGAYAEYIDEPYNIISMSMSALSIRPELLEKMSKDIYMLKAAGNRGSEGVYKVPFFKNIGAANAADVNGNQRIDFGELSMREYSSFDDDAYNVDFVGIDGFSWLGGLRYGTSYTTPQDAILSGQYYQLFKNKYGVFPTPKQSYWFSVRNTIKLDYNERSNQSGYGMFVLPDDDHIDFFTSIEISDNIIGASKLVGNNVIVDTDKLIGKSILTMQEAAYLTRRLLHHNRIDSVHLTGNLSEAFKINFLNYVNNSTGYIDKIENGEL